MGGEMASRREKGHAQRHGGGNEVARAGTPCPDQLSAQLDSPRPGRGKEIRQQGREKMLTVARFLSILLRQHLH